MLTVLGMYLARRESSTIRQVLEFNGSLRTLLISVLFILLAPRIDADALGLAVPGMPVGSPGMDGPVYQGRQDPYEVLLLLAGGGARVYQAYR